MWQKLTWMLFRQKSTREVLRKLWGCWFISGSMQSVSFEILSTSLCLSLSLSPFGPPPSLHLHPHPPPLWKHRHTPKDKSLCEPGQFPALMTSCLQTRWTVSQGSWSLTPSHCLSEPCILSLYSNDLWPNEPVNLAEYSEWMALT